MQEIKKNNQQYTVLQITSNGTPSHFMILCIVFTSNSSVQNVLSIKRQVARSSAAKNSTEP